MAMKDVGTRVRDAKIGQIFPKGTDVRCPNTKVKETVKQRKPCKK